MKMFQNITQVNQYKSCEEFVSEFEIGEIDFILATKTIYNKYFSDMGLKAKVFFKSDYGKGEPTDVMVNALLEDFRKSCCNRVIAIGGGAVIDMAKILVLAGNGDAADYYQRKIPLEKELPIIAVPTTCGAGSEVSSVSIAEFVEMGTKIGLADPSIFPDYAIIIPELLTELSYDFFATSAIDALIHAIESYVSPKANLYTRMFATKAMEMLLKGFKLITENGPEYRFNLLEEFLVASNLAGISFANAGTGAVHAMSYPLSGVYHVTHGEANYQFLTAVFKHYQATNPTGFITELNEFLGGVMGCDPDDVYPEIEKLLGKVIVRKPLREYGMKEDEIESFAVSVEKSQQRLLNQSYVKFDVEEMMEIYRELY